MSGVAGTQHNFQTLHNFLWGKLWLSYPFFSGEAQPKGSHLSGIMQQDGDRAGILTWVGSALSGAGHQFILWFPSLKLG